jgi:hypothetical protein
VSRTFLFFIVLTVLATPALAKAPTLEELPTGKIIKAKAKAAIEDRRREEEKAKRNPKLDLINAYADPSSSFYDWEEIVAILKDDKEEPEYRQRAAAAIRDRFRGVKLDGRIRDVKKRIAASTVRILKDGDLQERTWVYGIFEEFYEGTAHNIRYDPKESNYMRRTKAYQDWVKFLKK